MVNFITRDDFDSFGPETSAYVTEEGDSEVYDLNITWSHNFANDRGNITVFGGYLDRQESFAGQLSAGTSGALLGWHVPRLPVERTDRRLCGIDVHAQRGQADPRSGSCICVGAFGFTCEFSGVGTTFPNDRVTTNINYLAGNWDMHLTWRWIADTDNDAERFAKIIGFEDPIVSVPSAAAISSLFSCVTSRLEAAKGS